MAAVKSVKHLLVDKNNKTMVIIVAIASFVTVFSLVASKSLLSQQSYQKRVTTEKEKAVKQLKTNIAAVNELETHYKSFAERPENFIGGSSKGSGDKDGDNARLVLDALPSKYDFPALATSLEKVLTSQNLKIQSISGIDDEVNQGSVKSSESPAPVPMPFQVSFSGTYAQAAFLLGTLEKSIRPIQVASIDFSGTDKEMHIILSAQTYFQPGKNLQITTKVVK